MRINDVLRAHGIGGGKSKKEFFITDIESGFPVDDFVPFYTNGNLSGGSAQTMFAIYDKDTDKMIVIVRDNQLAGVYSKNNIQNVINGISLGGFVQEGLFFKDPVSKAIYFHENINLKWLYKFSSDLTSETHITGINRAIFDEDNSIFFVHTFSNAIRSLNINLQIISSVTPALSSYNDMFADGQYLFLLNSASNVIEVYDYNLNFIRNISVTENPRSIIVHNNRIYLLGNLFIKEIDYNTGENIKRISKSGWGGLFSEMLFYKSANVILVEESGMPEFPTGNNTGFRFFNLSLEQIHILGGFNTVLDGNKIIDDTLQFTQGVPFQPAFIKQLFVIPLKFKLK